MKTFNPRHPNNTDLKKIWQTFISIMTKPVTKHHLKTFKSTENLEGEPKCEDFVKKLMLTNRENTLNCHFSFTTDFLGNFELLKKVNVW